MKNILDKNKNSQFIYVISLVERSFPMEWFFVELNKKHAEFSIVFLNPFIPPIMESLRSLGLEVKWIKYTNKKSIPFVFLKILKLFFYKKPSVVHAHLFDASLIALYAAKIAGIKSRIHTRHHASHHHLFFPHAVKYDKMVNSWSTKIFAISENVKSIMVNDEGVNENKVHVVHHGFDFSNFINIDLNRIINLKQKYQLNNQGPIIGVISRYTSWKGIQFVIPAFKELLVKFPNAKLVLANAKGDYESEIKKLLQELPLNNFVEILFEEDTPALYKTFDCFVHVPVDHHSEAFGQVYIEALASGVPSVFTKSGIANEFIEHKKNAWVVDYKSSSGILNAIFEILDNNEDANIISENAKKEVFDKFGLERMINDTLKYYEQ